MNIFKQANKEKEEEEQTPSLPYSTVGGALYGGGIEFSGQINFK